MNLLNIEDIQIFEEATVESNIITTQKGKEAIGFPVANLGTDYILGDDLKTYFEEHNFIFEIPETSEWFIGQQEIGLLKLKIEENSKLLKKFDIEINRGFLTGYNDGFIIEEEYAQKLLSLDEKNKGLIKPILRGRDVGKYQLNSMNQWAICTFPSLKIDIDNYSSIYKHFESVGKKRLEQTGEKGSRKKTSHKW